MRRVCRLPSWPSEHISYIPAHVTWLHDLPRPLSQLDVGPFRSPGRALMVLPLAVLAGVGLSAYGATVISRSALKLTESGVKASIHRSVWEQVFLPIRRGKREITKTLVDGVSARMSEGIGAVGLYVWLWWVSGIESLNLSWIFWTVVAVVLSWIALTVYLDNRGCFQVDGFDPLLRLPDS